MTNYYLPFRIGRLFMLLAVLCLPIMTYASCDEDGPDDDGDECSDYTSLQPADVAGALGSSNSNGDTNCPVCQAGQTVGDPISEPTGNVYETEIDYTGSGAFPLQLVRYYNSQYTSSGSFGFNWSHQWDAKLQITASTVTVIRNEQKTLVFTLTGGVWQAGPNVNAKLTAVNGGWQYLNGLDGIESYDNTGRLISISNRAGLIQTLSYNATGSIASVSDPFGRTIAFSYDSFNRIIKATDPSGSIYTYAYNGNGNLISVTYPDKTKRQYNYASTVFPHALTSITNENNQTISSWSYSAGSISPNGVAVSNVQAGGVGQVSLQYDFVNGITTETDALGTTRSYHYQTINGTPLTMAETKPGSVNNNFNYDINGNVVRYTDFNNQMTNYTYDTTRNLETSRTLPDGTLISTIWNKNYRLPISISEPTRTTSYNYDSQGNLLQKTIIDANNSKNVQTWNYQYNSAGQVISIDGPRTDVSDITSFSYDKKGNLSTRTDALGNMTRFTSYDSNGRLLSLTDPNGLQTTLTYDLRGRLLSSKVGTETTSYVYDAAGNTIQKTFPDGSYLKFNYDAANRLIGLVDALGNSVVYTLNAMGNRINEQSYNTANALTQSINRSYDALDRLVKVTGSQNQTTTYNYDNNDNLTLVSDPLQNTTSINYDSRNRVTSRLAGSSLTSYSYSSNQLTDITDPNSNVTSYVYDGLGNKILQTSPDTGTTTYTYDAAGNIITSTDARGVETFYSYDALNRLIQKSYANNTFGDTSSASYSYDQGTNGIGHLTTMTDKTGSTTWQYDIHGRVTQKQQTIGTLKLSTNYHYDASGRLSQMLTPSNAQINYTYDANGQVNSISVGRLTVLSAVQYQPFSQITSWIWGNGTAYSRKYDLDGRLISVPLGTDTRSYTYDAASRITATTNNNTEQTLAATFDFSTSYNINIGSNILSSKTINLSSTQAMSNDLGGNLLSDGNRNYQYDTGGLLINVGSNTFGVDGLGKRVIKSNKTTGKSIYFVYDQSEHLLGEYGSSGQPFQETIWLGDIPIATGNLGKGVIYNIYTDHLNTPRVITTNSNRTIWSWVSDAFGNGAPVQNPDDFGNSFQYNLRFPGQYYDSETGLHYNNARYYNPSTGRYIQSDPIGLAGGTNTYAYVGNNPLSYADPNGTCPWCAGAIVGGIAGASTGLAQAYVTNGSTGQIIASTLWGGLSGGAIGAMNPLGSIAISSGLASGFGDFLGQQIVGASHTNWEEVGFMTGTGAMLGLAGAVPAWIIGGSKVASGIASGIASAVLLPMQIGVAAAAGGPNSCLTDKR